jgi:hypothetical protein
MTTIHAHDCNFKLNLKRKVTHSFRSLYYYGNLNVVVLVGHPELLLEVTVTSCQFKFKFNTVITDFRVGIWHATSTGSGSARFASHWQSGCAR